MRNLLLFLLFSFALLVPKPIAAQEDSTETTNPIHVLATPFAADELSDDDEPQGLQQILKTKFIEGNAGFMALVALALVLGLTFCIERTIFLILSETDTHAFMQQLSRLVKEDNLDAAKKLCNNTRGPVAAICHQGLLRVNEPIADMERSLSSFATVQAGLLEKGCSWITLFITIAPSLGFLGTVIGMVMAFDGIQNAGDISPAIVASGMKVALITTIFGIIAALVLQVFYNYILSRIDSLTASMEESTAQLLDLLAHYKQRYEACS